MRRQGTTTVEIKSGYGLTVRDEARSLAVARQFTDETTFLGAHVVPRGHRRPGGVRRAGHRPDAGGLRAARPLDRRVLRARRLRRRPGPRRPRGRRRAPGCAGGCTPTSSAPDPAYGWPRELGLAAVDHCTYLDDADVDALARLAAPSRRCCPAWSSRPGSPTPTRAGSSTPASAVALASDCNPGSCFTSSMPLCIALAVREMGMTPGRGACTPRPRPAARRPSTATTSARSCPGRGPTSCARRAQPRAPGLPPRRTPRHRHLGRPAGRSDAARHTRSDLGSCGV